MKKYLLSLIFIVTPLLASAQESLYESLVNEEKTWTMLSVGSTYPTSYWHQIYELKGDTLIDNLHFKKLYTETWLEGNAVPEALEFKGIYIGQDNKGGVYLYNTCDKKTRKTMDFSLKEGDIYSQEEEHEYLVMSVSDTILENSTDKKVRRCLRLGWILSDNSISTELRDTWIEGVGSLTNGLTGMYELGLPGGFNKLMKCTQQTATIYENKDETTLINTVERQPEKNDKFFDLQGRQLTTLPPMQRGFYIRNGKKYVVK